LPVTVRGRRLGKEAGVPGRHRGGGNLPEGPVSVGLPGSEDGYRDHGLAQEVFARAGRRLRPTVRQVRPGRRARRRAPLR